MRPLCAKKFFFFLGCINRIPRGRSILCVYRFSKFGLVFWELENLAISRNWERRVLGSVSRHVLIFVRATTTKSGKKRFLKRSFRHEGFACLSLFFNEEFRVGSVLRKNTTRFSSYCSREIEFSFPIPNIKIL